VDLALNAKLCARASLAPLLALGMFSAATVANAQDTPGTMNPPASTPSGAQPVGPAPRWPNSPNPPNAPNPPNVPDNITHRDVAEMNQFLDSHPEVAEQLRKDPSLIDNRRWVSDHPELRTYLRDHPQAADAFRAHPDLFMHDEERYNRQEGDRDISRRDIDEMGHFLNGHPEIAEQLRKDPSLIDNRTWVANHPALQEYMQTHPQVADAFRAHPDAFMRDEDRHDYDGRITASNRDERNRGELTAFGQFLGTHYSVASELSGDPSLANNKEYLASHPELDEYLKAHPVVTQQLAENPQAVMASNSVLQNGFTAKPVGPTKRPTPSTPNPNQ
jgi:hypothetical protein